MLVSTEHKNAIAITIENRSGKISNRFSVRNRIHPSLPAYKYSCAYPQYSPKCSRANRRIVSYSRVVSGASNDKFREIVLLHDPPDPDIDRECFVLLEREEQDTVGGFGPTPWSFISSLRASSYGSLRIGSSHAFHR